MARPSVTLPIVVLTLAIGGPEAGRAASIARPSEPAAVPAGVAVPGTIVAEDAETRKQRRADCKAQAEKLYPGQQKKFIKECMASKS
jgi:hypothetical protein